jgi:hypothetical protein
MTRGQRHRTRGHGHGGKRSPGCRVGEQIKSSIRFGFFMKNASSSPLNLPVPGGPITSQLGAIRGSPSLFAPVRMTRAESAHKSVFGTEDWHRL